MQFYTEEQILLYKFNERVLVDRKEATVKDIWTRTVRIPAIPGECDTFGTHLSFRVYEKEFWYQDISFERLSKLKGEILDPKKLNVK